MEVGKTDIPILLEKNTETLVSLKWLRGANRYNNGATRYKSKYAFRRVICRAKEKSRGSIQ
jgi:hypothetical protein